MASDNGSNNAITIFGKLDAPPTGPSGEPLTIDLAAIDTTMAPPNTETMGAETAAAGSGLSWDKFAPLAAALIVAGLVGAFAGAAATYGLSGDASAAPPAAATLSDETRTLRERVVRLSDELAQLKAGIENANRTAAQQLGRIGERLERAEKAQAEPAARLAKISESLDRLERRGAATLPPPDVTGSVTSIEKQQGKPTEVEGWKLRDYYAGRAVLESRNGTLYEVVPGANLPGVGKIETIKRVDGKIVVTTPKGIITSSLEPPSRAPYHMPRGY